MVRKPRGFTLVEILITVVLLTGGVIAIATVFNQVLLASDDSENVNLALRIANAKMEEVKDTAFASLADSGPTTDATFSDFDVTVNVAEGTDPMQVDVTVDWDTQGGETSIVLTTLVADL